MRRSLRVMAVVLAGLALQAPAKAKDFRWAMQADAQSLDPYALLETVTLALQGSAYEGLTGYDSDLKLIPVLATAWESTSPTTWRFTLRQGVKFHEGEAFTADDVIFSWKRAASESSDMKSYAAKAKDIRKIDDFTIEVETPTPNPILPREFAFLYIMSKSWCEAHGTTTSTKLKGGDPNNYANMHANGTGPFRVVERQPDVKTVFQRFDGYWKSIPTNVDRAVMTPIAQDSTRVAALVSGELDFAAPIPLQDRARLQASGVARVLGGYETRVIFLGMDQARPELLYSSVKGRNPLQDVRVREAFAHALDLATINEKVMRGAARPTGVLVASKVNGYDPALAAPYAYDPERSRQLLREAGYPDGFAITLDCPNDRYIDDEQICVAAAAMLAKVGIKVDVAAQTKSKYFGKVMAAGGYDTSFYLLGWSPSTLDAHNIMLSLLACRDDQANAGRFNLGGYCDTDVDQLTRQVQTELDPTTRQAMIDKAFEIVKTAHAYLPLHEQPLSWGVRDGVTVAQRADDILDLRNVVVP